MKFTVDLKAEKEALKSTAEVTEEINLLELSMQTVSTLIKNTQELPLIRFIQFLAFNYKLSANILIHKWAKNKFACFLNKL